MGIAVSIDHLNQMYLDLENRPRSPWIKPEEALRELVKDWGYKRLREHQKRLETMDEEARDGM